MQLESSNQALEERHVHTKPSFWGSMLLNLHEFVIFQYPSMSQLLHVRAFDAPVGLMGGMWL